MINFFVTALVGMLIGAGVMFAFVCWIDSGIGPHF
jgi:hypothetical protein